jgi:osmoprotectant transport system ATP-binding protein
VVARPAPVIRFLSVSKRFGEVAALTNIDLGIDAGSITVLLGPSGCGKTTLLRLVNGLARPDRGEVLVAGAPLASGDIHAARRRIGYVIQEGGLFPHLAAADNVTLAARYLRWPVARIAARLDELAGLARLPPEALRRFPAELSGGQRQRVALMRALMLDPEILLLDEPLGALDPLVRAELQADLAAVFRSLGKTVVMVTHDLPEAAFLADRVVLLRAGAVVQDGTVDDLLQRPADPFVSAFVNAQRAWSGSGRPGGGA